MESCWSYIFFEKEVIFHEFDFETSELDFEVSKSSIWNQTTLCDKGVIIISQLWRPAGLLLYVNFEIHQVRRLVFDNYQRCPVYN